MNEIGSDLDITDDIRDRLVETAMYWLIKLLLVQ